jgi:hypothetical protein
MHPTQAGYAGGHSKITPESGSPGLIQETHSGASRIDELDRDLGVQGAFLRSSNHKNYLNYQPSQFQNSGDTIECRHSCMSLAGILPLKD